jgi:hypothetical protein
MAITADWNAIARGSPGGGSSLDKVSRLWFMESIRSAGTPRAQSEFGRGRG